MRPDGTIPRGDRPPGTRYGHCREPAHRGRAPADHVHISSETTLRCVPPSAACRHLPARSVKHALDVAAIDLCNSVTDELARLMTRIGVGRSVGAWMPRRVRSHISTAAFPQLDEAASKGWAPKQTSQGSHDVSRISASPLTACIRWMSADLCAGVRSWDTEPTGNLVEDFGEGRTLGSPAVVGNKRGSA